jgi:aryl-alcohol dehydrogenase-like predicted oxidoreductase
MQYGSVPGVEKPISRLVQGIIQINRDDEAVGFAQLDAAFEAGITAVDTAYIYGNADRFLGKWIAERGNRDQVVILSKCAHHGERKKVTPYDIEAELHDILVRMKVDYVDLLVLHRDDPDYPVAPIVDTLSRLVSEGKVKAFGGSNWTTERLQEANLYAQQTGQTPFAVSSPNFSLAAQIKEPWSDCVTISGPAHAEARAWYEKTQLPVFSWSSMAGGFWSGRFTRENIADERSDYFEKLVQECYASEENFTRLDRVKEIGAAKGLTIPQVALAYILNYPMNVFALVGSANKEELAANVAAVAVTLTPEELAYLDLRD